MSDSEGGNDFEAGDAGSSFSVPTQVGSIKKGGYCMLKGKPCKVIEYSTAKPGKHGSAKATIVGVDIFTGKKYEDGGPTASNIMVPIVNKLEYEIIDVTDDNFATLQLGDGTLKENLKMPADTPELVDTIKKSLDDGRETYVTVVNACGEEKIVETRTK